MLKMSEIKTWDEKQIMAKVESFRQELFKHNMQKYSQKFRTKPALHKCQNKKDQ